MGCWGYHHSTPSLLLALVIPCLTPSVLLKPPSGPRLRASAVSLLFEAVGHMISASPLDQRGRLLAQILGLFNDQWAGILRGLSAAGALEARPEDRRRLGLCEFHWRERRGVCLCVSVCLLFVRSSPLGLKGIDQTSWETCSFFFVEEAKKIKQCQKGKPILEAKGWKASLQRVHKDLFFFTFASIAIPDLRPPSEKQHCRPALVWHQ